jgi:tRNA(fMet)-specific endonuclease VapC
MRYLWDTNILLHYLNDSVTSKYIERKYKLVSPINKQHISVVSLGEIKSLAKRRNWGNAKLNRLFALLEKFVISDINIGEIIERYAEIDAFSQGKLFDKSVQFSAKNMGKNDVWIAATASVLQIPLITTDKDFNHLDKVYLDLKLVDLKDL